MKLKPDVFGQIRSYSLIIFVLYLSPIPVCRIHKFPGDINKHFVQTVLQNASRAFGQN